VPLAQVAPGGGDDRLAAAMTILLVGQRRAGAARDRCRRGAARGRPVQASPTGLALRGTQCNTDDRAFHADELDRYSAELAEAGCEEQITGTYLLFQQLNQDFLIRCLREIHSAARPTCSPLTTELARYLTYQHRLTAAPTSKPASTSGS
jgi:hypothetical protein